MNDKYVLQILIGNYVKHIIIIFLGYGCLDNLWNIYLHNNTF